MPDLRTHRARRAILAGALAATAWVALGAIADGYARHGWSARWYTLDQGERALVDRTTEHRVAFPNAHRPLARYVQGWPSELPIPTALPSIDAELRARVTVPSGPALFLGADARQTATVEVDGRPAAEAAVPPGAHDVAVRWTGRPAAAGRSRTNAESVSFALTWGPTLSSLSPVPRDAIEPADGAWPWTRVALWWAVVALSLLFALGAAYAAHADDTRARLRRAGMIATALVVLLGTGYRALDYDVMPEFRENADELFATWNGWSLLEDGTTRGWSLWPHAYGGTDVERTEVRFFGETRIVIQPYFEHPPLLHVLVGAAAHLGGADSWLEAKLSHTRLVPIALSALSLFLLVALGRRLMPRSPAPWIGALLYAVIPTIALQTRVIKEEALLVPLSLGMLLFFLRWRDDGKKTRDLILAAVCAGLAPIAKVPAIVWVPALVMLVAAERGAHRKAILAAFVGLATASLLLVFGAAIDWDVFVFTQGQQGGRPTHWNLFPRFFDATLINHSLIGRGWILFLWLGFAASVYRRGARDTAILTVPLVTYLIAIAVGSGNWTFGWYIVPLYPFLCLGAGDLIAQLWRRLNLIGGALFVVLLVMYSLNFTLDPHWAKQPEAWPILRRAVTLTVALSIAPYALVQVWRESALCVRLARIVTVLGLAAVVVLSGVFIATYDVTYETYRDFDRDTYFHR
jgi:4-amino-4-deoxy-L-arabinose transferase-like glycosyltransferase